MSDLPKAEKPDPKAKPARKGDQHLVPVALLKQEREQTQMFKRAFEESQQQYQKLLDFSRDQNAELDRLREVNVEMQRSIEATGWPVGLLDRTQEKNFSLAELGRTYRPLKKS